MAQPDEPNDVPAASAGHPDPTDGSTAAQPDGTSSWVERLLDNKTGPQRIVISLGALATALIAIGGLVTTVVRMIDDDDDVGGGLDRAPGETQRIESGAASADEFVRDLLDHDGGVVALDHQVIADQGPADVRLQYDCTETGVCVMARVQDVVVEAGNMADGLWFQGCFAVTQDGVGYGAEPLDIELERQGATCA